jgi:uncharacterized protein YerC
MTAEIHKMPEPKPNLHCAQCGVIVKAQCGCGVGYITAGKAAAQAVKAHPEKSDRAIAEEIGVGTMTVSRARKATVPNGTVEKRTGRDGKARKQPKPSKVSDEQRDRIATKVLDQGKTWKEVTAEEGVSATVLRRSKAYLEGKRDGQADPIIDPTTLSLSAQEKLAAALRQQKAIHEREFQQRLEDGISRWIEETTIASYADEYSKIRSDIEGRTGIMTAANYKLIQRCLHPDNSASPKMRAEAFVLWEKLKYRFCDNTEMPVHFRVMPENSAGFEALRKAAQEARRAKRNGSTMANR